MGCDAGGKAYLGRDRVRGKIVYMVCICGPVSRDEIPFFPILDAPPASASGRHGGPMKGPRHAFLKGGLLVIEQRTL